MKDLYNWFKVRFIFPFRRIKVKKLLRVYKAVGMSLIRVGDGGEKNDGAYVMLDDFGNGGLAYSCGLGTEIWWDEDMIKRGYEVYGFDHTIEKVPYDGTKLKWIKKGISAIDDELNNLLSLETIFRTYGHDYIQKSDDERKILKMDIEGWEWESLATLSSDTLKEFDQITLEMHALSDPYKTNIRVLEKLLRTHCPVWIHANNAGELIRGFVDIPSTLEVTYASRDRYKFERTAFNSPIEIDKINVEERTPIELFNWGSL